MHEYIVAIMPEGQITIPQEVRRLLNLSSGDTVLFRIVDGTVQFTKTSKLLAGFGAVEPHSENFQTVRKEFEKEVAGEVSAEM